MKETARNCPGRWPTTDRKGFISLHLCIVLAMTLSITASLYQAVHNYHEFRKELDVMRQLNWL